MAGYQRALEGKRSSSLTTYLELSPKNVVPGAIIVAIDDEYVDVEMSKEGIARIRIREDDRDFETKLQELWGAFTTRLSEEELNSANIDFGQSEDDEDDDTDDDPDSPEEDKVPRSYLAVLAKELTDAVSDWNAVPSIRQQAIREFIDGASKPGLIIDGQHRVFGAKEVKGDVVLPVVLLPGLEHAEQVFQFYVLNSKARPLRPTELRRIVSTSLTGDEIGTLYERFRQAGVVADEARWTYEVNTRPESPFAGRINLGFNKPGEAIKENVADQVVRAFMKMPRRRYKQLTDPLGERWTDADQRLEIFFWFWNAVKAEYADAWKEAEAQADKGTQPQLFMKVALLTLQRFLLDRFVTALSYIGDKSPPLASEEGVRTMVKATLAHLPGEFFVREWKMKQIDTNDGRRALYETMEKVHGNQGKLHGKMKLFQG